MKCAVLTKERYDNANSLFVGCENGIHAISI